MKSLRRNLLIGLLSALVLATAVTGWSTYNMAFKNIKDMYNDQLHVLAASVPDRIPAGAVFEPAHVTSRFVGADPILQVWNLQKQLVYQSKSGLAMPCFPGTGFREVVWHHTLWRLYLRRTQTNFIQVAQSIDARQRIAEKQVFHMMLPLFAFIPFMGVLIWLIVDRSLQSLNRIAKEVDRRSPSELEELSDHELPREIVPMVKALNSLFARLRHALVLERRFIADAAHELRTPLAALQVQAEVAEQTVTGEEARAAIASLKAGIERGSHLVEQLLTLSRLDPEAPVEMEPVLLDKMVRDLFADYWPLADRKKIDLGMAESQPAWICGNPGQMRMLVRNLIDNAIRYTPDGGRIDVNTRAEGSEVILEVEDSGPGIPPEDRMRVFDRFYRRIGNTARGSGLGLAIVKEIADKHGATISLHGSGQLGGLRVVVRFAKLETATPRS